MKTGSEDGLKLHLWGTKEFCYRLKGDHFGWLKSLITKSCWEGQIMKSTPSDEAYVGLITYLLNTCHRLVALKAETVSLCLIHLGNTAQRKRTRI